MKYPFGWTVVLSMSMSWCSTDLSQAQEANPSLTPPLPPVTQPQTGLPGKPARASATASSSSSPTVLVQPDGTLKLRHGGPEAPFEPIEPAELDAKWLNSTHVLLQTAADTPMEQVRRAMELLKAAGATAITVQPARANEPSEIKIMQLANNSAGPLAAMLQQLYGGNNTTILADERTNSLIVRGPSKSLSEIEAIAARLDQPSAAGNSALLPSAAPRWSTQPPVATSTASTLNATSGPATAPPASEYNRHNQRTQQLASQLRQLGADADKSQQRDAMQLELRKEVEAAFDARQRQQVDELARLRQRLSEVEQTIASRQRLKEEIIGHRIAELIDPSRQWEPEPAASYSTTATVSVPVGMPPQASNVPDGGTVQPGAAPRPTWAAPPAASLDPFATPNRLPTPGLGGVSILRNADEFSRELGDAETRLQHLSKTTPRGFSSEAELAAAERHLKAIRAEYAAQLKLLALELQNALLAEEKARNDLSRVEKLIQVKSGSISTTELDQYRLTASQAQLRVAQLKTLYELYQNVGETPKSPEPKQPTQVPDEQPAPTLPRSR